MEINALWRYPVKSMLGERRERVELTPTGVAGDRAYAVIDRSDGKVASAKNPRKWRILLDCHAELVDEPAPDNPTPPARITLPTEASCAPTTPTWTTSCRSSSAATSSSPIPRRRARRSRRPGPTSTAWLRTKFIESTRVRSDEGEAVSDLALGLAAAPGSFFDLAPVHLVTTSSLDELTRLQPASQFVPERFRPNIVVGSSEAGFVENAWVGATVRLGADAGLTVMMPTMRCVMTTLAQRDLPADRAILRTATDHNRVEITGLGHWACVGAYASVATAGLFA